eukprot:8666821-Karenia_brevis.AAC.1
MSLREWADLPLASLRKYLAAFQKWRVWCTDRGCEYVNTDPVHIALYLYSLRVRGGTVPHSVYWSLKWLSDNMGMTLDLQNKRVVSQSAIPPSHIPAPAVPLSIKWLCFWAHM